MPRAPKSSKPEPFGVEPVRCRATRGPKGGKWYWRAVTYAGGDEAPFWSGWATRDEAYRTIVEKVAAGVKAPDVPPSMVGTLPERPTIRDLLETWIPVVRARPKVPAMTVTTYRRSARRLLRFAGDWLISELRATALEDLAQQMRTSGLAPSSVRLSFVVLDLALDWGRPRGWIAPDVKMPKISKDGVREKYTPTSEEVLAVFWRLPPKWWYRAAYRLLWATGMRVTCEAGALVWGDVGIVQGGDGKPTGRIHVPDGKTGRRWVFCDVGVIQELERLGRGEPDQRIFPRTHFRKRLQAAIDRARGRLEKDGIKIPRWTTHGFRRAAIRAGRRASVDTLTMATMMGNSPTTIHTYYEEITQEDMREAAARVKLGVIVTRDREP